MQAVENQWHCQYHVSISVMIVIWHGSIVFYLSMLQKLCESGRVGNGGPENPVYLAGKPGLEWTHVHHHIGSTGRMYL